MIEIKTEQEIAIMRQAGKILAKTLQEVKKNIQPGVKAIQLDQIAQQIIEAAGAKPAFKGYKGYPSSICVSINDELVHGLPIENKIIKEGDLVGIDCGVLYQGYNVDAAFTYGVDKISEQAEKLLKVTEDTLKMAIFLVRPGASLKSIQKEIQQKIEKTGFSVIRDLSGHAIGKELQEKPAIANYPVSGPDIILKKGMVFCLEPMVSAGGWRVKTAKDGWTALIADASLSAHFEHTLLVTDNGCEILTI